MGETKGLVFLFCGWSVLIAGGWMVLAWSRKSYLESAEITSCVFLVLFQDGGGLSSRFSCVVQGMKTYFLNLRKLLKIEYILWKWDVGVYLDCKTMEFVIAG